VAQATVIHVPGGQPTIQAGIGAAFDGDTVLVGPGTYAENIDFFGKAISVTSAEGVGMTTIIPGFSNESTVQCTTGESSETELSGFTFTGSAQLGPPVIAINGTSGLRVQRCVFADNPVDNVVIRCNGSGIMIRYNLFIGNGGTSCIGVGSGSANIINNTFDGNQRGFYAIGGVTIAKNNIVTNSAEYGVFGVFDDLSYNNVWNNNPNYSGGATAGTGELSADPLFVDPTQDDYTLRPDSPCIDAGDSDPSFNDPDGTRNDIGAFPAGGFDVLPPSVLNLTVGSPGDSLYTTDHTPSFFWTYSDPWDLPLAGSEIEVGTDDDWTVAEMWDPPPIDGDADSTTYTGAGLEDGNTYYVRVRVFNATLWSDWLAAPFRMNTPPTICTPLFPPSGAIVLTSSPTLVTMNSTDADGDSLYYDFVISLDPAHVDIQDSTLGIEEGFGQTDWTTKPLSADNQLHWWQVRASDGYENGPWSDIWSLWLDGYNDPPEPPVLTSPSDAEASSVLQPLLEWEAAVDPDPGALASYTVAVATDSNLLSKTEVHEVDSTFLEWPLMLAPFTQHWWSVTADDGRSGVSISEVRSFYTEIECGPCPYQSDFDEDGVITIVDMGALIDVLFVGGTDPQDPGCPVTRGDFDCDGFTTSLDMSGLIDHLFAGGEGPCEPCGELSARTVSDSLSRYKEVKDEK
jgi:hypothetical protein